VFVLNDQKDLVNVKDKEETMMVLSVMAVVRCMGDVVQMFSSL